MNVLNPLMAMMALAMQSGEPMPKFGPSASDRAESHRISWMEKERLRKEEYNRTHFADAGKSSEEK